MSDSIGKMSEIGETPERITVSIPDAEEHFDSPMGPVATPLNHRPTRGADYGQPADTKQNQRPLIPAGLSEMELRHLLRDKQKTAVAADRALATARDGYKREIDTLNANKKYMADAEYQAKLQAIQDERLPGIVKSERKLKTISEDLVHAAREVASRAATSPPTLADPDAEARASQLLPLVQSEVASLPIATLRDKFRVAIMTNDLASIYCYSLVLPSRLRMSGTTVNADGTVSRDGTDTERAEIQSLLASSKTKLKDTRMAALARDAHTVSKEAGKMRWDAEARQRKARRYIWQQEGDVQIDKETGRAVDAEPIGPRRR